MTTVSPGCSLLGLQTELRSQVLPDREPFIYVRPGAAAGTWHVHLRNRNSTADPGDDPIVMLRELMHEDIAHELRGPMTPADAQLADRALRHAYSIHARPNLPFKLLQPLIDGAQALGRRSREPLEDVLAWVDSQTTRVAMAHPCHWDALTRENELARKQGHLGPVMAGQLATWDDHSFEPIEDADFVKQLTAFTRQGIFMSTPSSVMHSVQTDPRRAKVAALEFDHVLALLTQGDFDADVRGVWAVLAQLALEMHEEGIAHNPPRGDALGMLACGAVFALVARALYDNIDEARGMEFVDMTWQEALMVASAYARTPDGRHTIERWNLRFREWRLDDRRITRAALSDRALDPEWQGVPLREAVDALAPRDREAGDDGGDLSFALQSLGLPLVTLEDEKALEIADDGRSPGQLPGQPAPASPPDTRAASAASEPAMPKEPRRRAREESAAAATGRRADLPGQHGDAQRPAGRQPAAASQAETARPPTGRPKNPKKHFHPSHKFRKKSVVRSWGLGRNAKWSPEIVEARRQSAEERRKGMQHGRLVPPPSRNG